MIDPALILVHGVGRVYESPIPVSFYFFGAALTVLISFVLRALVRGEKPFGPERQIAGPGVERVFIVVLRVVGVVTLLLALASGIISGERGPTLTTHLLWVACVVGITFVSAVLDGVWLAADPWATGDAVFRLGEEPEASSPPWWIAPRCC